MRREAAIVVAVLAITGCQAKGVSVNKPAPSLSSAFTTLPPASYASPSVSSARTAAPTYTPMGQAITVRGQSLSATGSDTDAVTQRVKVLVDSHISNIADPAGVETEPPAAGWYAVFDIEIHEVAGSASANFLDFRMIDNGHSYSPGGGNALYSGYGAEPEGLLSTAPLEPGSLASGLVVFDVPKPHGVLTYAPGYDGGLTSVQAEWRFPSK